MEHKCGGQDTGNLDSDLYECPACAAEVELFSNEEQTKCHNCGKMVKRRQG